MVEDEGDGLGIEADVEGVEHAARHGHAEVAFVKLGRVGTHHRHSIAKANAVARQHRGELAAAGIGLGPTPAQIAMNHGRALGIDGGAALDEGERAEHLVVGRDLVEVALIGVGHVPSPGQAILVDLEVF